MDSERLLAVLRGEPERSFALDELMALAKVSQKKEKDAKRILKGLVRDGAVEREPGRRYRMSRAGQGFTGRVIVDRKGEPLFIADGEPRGTPGVPFLEDIEPAEGRRMRRESRTSDLPSPSRLAQDDRVRVELVHRGRRPRPFAKLVELIERPERHYIGLFRDLEGALIVELDESPGLAAGQTRRITEVLVPPNAANGAEDGELVEVSFDPFDGTDQGAPIGRVVEVLGAPGERATEMRKLIIEHGLERPFPPEVIAQAEAFGELPTEDDMSGRRDVRDLPLMTIDGDDSKDFDDAVCAVRDGKDRYRLYVAIADVSHYVRIGTPLDEEAYYRGTSTYLTDRAIPMLPENLSNGLCSLNPNVDRLCMLAEMSVSASGRIIDATFSRAVMRSKARLTYNQVARALEGEPDEATQKVLPTLLLLSTIAGKMLERRLRRGSLDLDLPEPVVVFDDEGLPTTATRRPRNPAHRLIEDLMIACNEAAARFFLERDLDSLYRVHAPPDPDKMAAFAKLCLDLGIDAHVSDRPSPAEVSHLLSILDEHPQGKALHALLLRALTAARYAPDNEGHFGLASESYLHFTSPIRRYPDLIVHRLMKRALDGERPWYSHAHLGKMGDDTSNAERRAMMAERASMELDRALIARKHLGETLPGTVTGLQTFGLFIATLEPFLEGMAPVQTLPDDFYESDEHGATLIGTRNGHRFSLGDSVEVIVHAVNLSRRQVELRVVEPARTAPTESSKGPETYSSKKSPVSKAARLDPKKIAKKMGASAPKGGGGGAKGGGGGAKSGGGGGSRPRGRSARSRSRGRGRPSSS